jgi:glyoxylase-like metal-dependent hydrolase (beta-lactamase superfamily II)
MPLDCEAILPGLWKLTDPARSINSYLLRTDRGSILIDPTRAVTPQIVAETGAAPVCAIVSTHLQREHVEGCYNFEGVPVHIPAGDEYLCEGEEAYRKHITPWPPPWAWETRGNYLGHVAGAANERPLPRPVRLAAALSEGQTIASLEVLSTPGHGKHAVTLITKLGGKTVGFCGDTIYDADWDYGAGAGYRALAASLLRLKERGCDLLLPAHGPVIDRPGESIALLVRRLEELRAEQPVPDDARPIDAPAEPLADAPGWFKLLPHLYQWRDNAGNANLIVSKSGHGLLIDDGLCQWVDLDERARRHTQAMNDIKRVAGVSKIEVVIPTHYHGDHVENIPEIVASDGTKVVSLDIVADRIEFPERYNLCCPLPWYGTRYDRVRVDERLQAGETFHWREYAFEIFLLAGQTYFHAGSVATIDGRRVLFSGDSLGGTQCEPVLCYNDNEPEHRGWAYAVERMIEHNPDLIVNGHGSAIVRPMPLLRHRRAIWAKQLERYRALCPRPSLREFFDPFIQEN